MANPTQQPPQQPKAAPPQPKAQHMGFDPLRPVRYGFGFTKGATVGLLDGMAGFGRKGAWAGAGLGILMGIAGTFSGGLILGMALTGLVVGAGAGAAIGAVTGGTNAIGRAHRREKYADELSERQQARAAREARTQKTNIPAPDYRDQLEYRRRAANFNFDRALQQEMENDRDYGTYWQDRVSQSQSNGNGRGF